MAHVQRPLIIQSHVIRLCCPRTTRRTSSALFARGNHHKELHTKTVTDNDISRLASLPLHPLTLADLVKYVYSGMSFVEFWLIAVA
jgi:hypothetical protein